MQLMWTIAVTAIIALAIVVIYAIRNRDRSFPVEEHLLVIEAAIRNGNDLKMNYFTYRSRSFRTRTVTPLELGESGTYLRAYDHFRLANRTFKVSRIREISEVRRKPTIK